MGEGACGYFLKAAARRGPIEPQGLAADALEVRVTRHPALPFSDERVWNPHSVGPQPAVVTFRGPGG